MTRKILLPKLGIKKITDTDTYITQNKEGNHVNIKEKTEINYNHKGKKTKQKRVTYYLDEPYNTIQTIFIYNSNDKINYENSFLIEDSIAYKISYLYKNKKLQKKEAFYIHNEKEIEYNEIYSYNFKGELTKSNYNYSEKKIDSNKLLKNLKATNIFNKKRQIIEIDWTKSDSSYKFNRFVYKRNNKGLIVKEKEYDNKNKIVKILKYKYIFDSKKNWTVSKCYENNILIKTIYREIEYY